MNIRLLCAGYPRLAMPVPEELARQLYDDALETGPGWAEEVDLDAFVLDVGKVVTDVDHLPGTPIVFPRPTLAMSFSGNFAEAYDVPFETFSAADLLVDCDWPLDWNTATFVATYAFRDIQGEMFLIAFPNLPLDEVPSLEEQSVTQTAVLYTQVIAKYLLRALGTAYRGKSEGPFQPGGEFNPKLLSAVMTTIEALFGHWSSLQLATLASAGSGTAAAPVAHLIALLERELLLARFTLAACEETTTPSEAFLDYWREFFTDDARYDAIFGDDEAQLFEQFQEATRSSG